MKKIISTIALSSIFLAGMVQGQNTPVGSYYSANWNISLPIGDFSKWISPASFFGFSATGRYFLIGGFGLGWSIGYNNYYEKVPYETYFFEGGAISASHYNYTYMVPFRMDVFYNYKPAGIISPYLALGIGGNYQENHLLIQDYDLYENTWNFILNPELGAVIRFGEGSSWGVRMGVNYLFTTARTEYYDLKNFQSVNFNLGIVYTVF